MLLLCFFLTSPPLLPPFYPRFLSFFPPSTFASPSFLPSLCFCLLSTHASSPLLSLLLHPLLPCLYFSFLFTSSSPPLLLPHLSILLSFMSALNSALSSAPTSALLMPLFYSFLPLLLPFLSCLLPNDGSSLLLSPFHSCLPSFFLLSCLLSILTSSLLFALASPRFLLPSSLGSPALLPHLISCFPSVSFSPSFLLLLSLLSSLRSSPSMLASCFFSTHASSLLLPPLLSLLCSFRTLAFSLIIFPCCLLKSSTVEPNFSSLPSLYPCFLSAASSPPLFNPISSSSLLSCLLSAFSPPLFLTYLSHLCSLLLLLCFFPSTVAFLPIQSLLPPASSLPMLPLCFSSSTLAYLSIPSLLPPASSSSPLLLFYLSSLRSLLTPLYSCFHSASSSLPFLNPISPAAPF